MNCIWVFFFTFLTCVPENFKLRSWLASYFCWRCWSIAYQPLEPGGPVCALVGVCVGASVRTSSSAQV